MGPFKVLWKISAERDLRNLDPKQIPRIIEAVEALAGNPYPPQHRKIWGAEKLYRIRIGDYRVIYHIETEERNVTIYHIRHRRRGRMRVAKTTQ